MATEVKIASDNFYVLVLKIVSLVFRAIPILIFYLEKSFKLLGEYSLVSSISVIASSIIGLELHMVANRNISRINDKNLINPLKNHIILIVYLTAIISIVFCLFDQVRLSYYISVIASFYILGEHVRFLNFSKNILGSAVLNVVRDLLFILPFIFLNFSSIWFGCLSYLYFWFAAVYTFRKANSFKFRFSEWTRMLREYWIISRIYLINIFSRNMLAYLDRIFVISTSGSEALGKYAIIAYVHTSITTLVSGSVIYVRIPLLISKEINGIKFLRSIIFRALLLIASTWLTFYILLSVWSFSNVELSAGLACLFCFYGLFSIFYGASGQLLYARDKDVVYVISSILLSVLLFLIALVSPDKEYYLLGAVFATLVVTLYRLKIVFK